MSPADADLLPSSPPGADALAVVVTAGVTPYLRRTLRAVARQTRAPGVVLLIDVASRGNGLGDGTPVEEAVSGSGLDARSRARIVRVPEAEGFGDAVVRGLDRYADLVETGVRRNSPAMSDRPQASSGARRRRPGGLARPRGHRGAGRRGDRLSGCGRRRAPLRLALAASRRRRARTDLSGGSADGGRRGPFRCAGRPQAGRLEPPRAPARSRASHHCLGAPGQRCRARRDRSGSA